MSPAGRPPLASFIVPTLGRPSLQRTIESLYSQTDDDWEGIIILDPSAWQFEISFEDSRMSVIGGPEEATGSAGELRNAGISEATGEWACFVDDDDHLGPHYVEHLREHSDTEADMVIFRMDDPRFGVLPRIDAPVLGQGQVGISYAVKREFMRGHKFVREDVSRLYHEDWELLATLYGAGANIFLSPHIDYFVRDAGQ